MTEEGRAMTYEELVEFVMEEGEGEAICIRSGCAS